MRAGAGGLSQLDAPTGSLIAFATAPGAVAIANGATLGVTGTTSLASASGITDNGTLDISGTTAGTTAQTVTGSVLAFKKSARSCASAGLNSTSAFPPTWNQVVFASGVSKLMIVLLAYCARRGAEGNGA